MKTEFFKAMSAAMGSYRVKNTKRIPHHDNDGSYVMAGTLYRGSLKVATFAEDAWGGPEDITIINQGEWDKFLAYVSAMNIKREDFQFDNDTNAKLFMINMGHTADVLKTWARKSKNLKIILVDKNLKKNDYGYYDATSYVEIDARRAHDFNDWCRQATEKHTDREVINQDLMSFA